MDWSGTTVKADQQNNPNAVALAVVGPMYIGREPWPQKHQPVKKLVVLPSSEYRRFRDRLLSKMVPSNGRDAIQVSVGDEQISLYFDSAGQFHSVVGELPPGIGISERFSLEKYLASAPEVLEKLLAEQGISSGEVLFNTDDHGEDALPFLYANLDTRTGLLFHVGHLGEQSAEGLSVIPVTQSMVHLVHSHTTGLVSRAVSSLFRLMFVVTHVATDTFDLAPLLALTTEPLPPLSTGPGMNLVQWEEDLDRMFNRKAETGKVRYLIDGEIFFTRFEAALKEAKDSISIRTYIFDNDDYALQVADLLRSRSSEHLEVRILLDGLGTLSAASGGNTTSVHRYLEQGSRVDVRSLPNPFLLGDHTKAMIIDEHLAYVGGMNIGREYRYEWHDLMVELEGPIVDQLADDFDVSWASAGFWGDLGQFFRRLKPSRQTDYIDQGYPVRLLYTRSTASEIRSAQLAAIRRARQYIYLENAYLTDDTFLEALVNARRRGVDVRVVIPLQSDRGLLTRDNILTANKLFKYGVRVYIYPGMSHVKAGLFDGWACLGSANLDNLSLRVNFEANIATSEASVVNELREQLFELDFRRSPEMERAFPTRWNDRLWEMVGDYLF
jgi:cardiolipin synthase